MGANSKRISRTRASGASGRREQKRHYDVHRLLARAFNFRTFVAVIGSGLSQPLGYPSWHNFASNVVKLTQKHLRNEDKRLSGFLKRLTNPDNLRPHDVVFFLGYCQEILFKPGAGRVKYYDLLSETFGYSGKPKIVHDNPYDALVKLPIDRYVTTNYDCEIERALARAHKLPLTDFGLDSREHMPDADQRSIDVREHLSFTQTPRSRGQLALFALGRLPATSYRVFHCHGRFDDPESIVASEANYQRWYLADSANVPSTFLDSLDLLFSSNPILFIGYSLRDEDLLRPLRIISATESHRKSTRPLFALLPTRSSDNDRDYHDSLFERYGIHVIPFTEPSPPTPENWGKSYCGEFDKFKQNWRDRREGWLEKPYFRKVQVEPRPPNRYQHHGLDLGGYTLGRETVEKNSQDLLNETQDRREGERRVRRDDQDSSADIRRPAQGRIIVIVGPGGTGKSWHALKLMDELWKRDKKVEPHLRYAGFFFWSSYYADDYVTGLDRFLVYADTHTELQTSSRLQRLKDCLRKHRYFIIFDGFERMLRQTESEDPREGVSYHPNVKTLLVRS